MIVFDKFQRGEYKIHWKSFVTYLIIYNIIMSKNLDEAKLRRMVVKYRKFKAKNAQGTSQSRTDIWLLGLMEKCEKFWCKIVPPCVRGYKDEYELFTRCWQAQVGKGCSNALISKLSVEENLRNYSPGQPVVLGLVYSPQSMQKITSYINHLPVEMFKSDVVFCPINTEGRAYRSEIEPKIILFEETVVIFWKGLFNEMILLSKFRLQEGGLFKSVKQEVAARVEYETRIRDAAEGGKFSENNSQELM